MIFSLSIVEMKIPPNQPPFLPPVPVVSMDIYMDSSKEGAAKP